MVFIYADQLYEVYMHWRSEPREIRAPAYVWLNRRWNKAMPDTVGWLCGATAVIRRSPMPGMWQGTCECAMTGSTAVARSGDQGVRGPLARGWS